MASEAAEKWVDARWCELAEQGFLGIGRMPDPRDAYDAGRASMEAERDVREAVLKAELDTARKLVDGVQDELRKGRLACGVKESRVPHL